MTKIVDLSPAVPHGFKGPPSTDLGVQMNVRTKTEPGFWQSTQIDLMSLHTGAHVESALHSIEGLVNLRDLPPRVQFFAPFYKFEGIESAVARILPPRVRRRRGSLRPGQDVIGMSRH